eukprot:6197421-Pleurochrysis_carterae.AAC.2
MAASTWRTLRKLQGEVLSVLQTARRAVSEDHRRKLQLTYEARRRHELSGQVEDLQQQLAAVRAELSDTKRATAAETCRAEKLTKLLKQEQGKVQGATEEYRRRAQTHSSLKKQEKDARKAHAVAAAAIKEKEELGQQLKAVQDKLAAAEARTEQLSAEHNAELEAAAEAAEAEAEAAAEVAAAAAQFIPPNRPNVERLAQLSEARQSQ